MNYSNILNLTRYLIKKRTCDFLIIPYNNITIEMKCTSYLKAV